MSWGCDRDCGRTIRRAVAGALAAAVGLVGLAASAQPSLLSEVAGPAGNAVREEPAKEGEATVSGPLPPRLVRVDTTLLASVRADLEARDAGPAVALNLFDAIGLTAVFERAAPTASGYALAGRLEDERFGTVTLVVDGELVAATVRTAGATYRIRSVGPGVHAVEQVEPTVPNEDDVVDALTSIAPPLLRPRESDDEAAEDDGSEIDVLAFYTRGAREALGGARRTRAQIDLAVAETNGAYEAGGAVQRIRLVGAVETDYAETDNDYEDLRRFRENGDGHMDDVHVLRDAYAADLLVLVVECCGGLASVQPYDPAWGFALTSLSSSRSHWLSARVFAHELGHTMGLQHDRYAPYTNLNYPFPYSHGYVNQAAFEDGAPENHCWTTIMAYSHQCWDAGMESVPILRFSNPGQRYPDTDGDPMGVPGDEPSDAVDGPSDAVRSLDETRGSVAGFRLSAERCVYRVSPGDFEVGADGGEFTVEVEVEGADCPREAKARDGFLAVLPDADEGGFRVRIEPNAGWARFGTVSVAAETVEVRQRGGRSMAAVCDRSAWIRDAITAHAGREDCAGVTEFEVASIHELDLRGRGIEGTVAPGDLDGLAGLAVLDLGLNRLAGGFPDLEGLARLKHLDLSGNDFGGELPAGIGKLDRLLYLNVGGNAFTGAIPTELGKLGRLRTLYLSDNALAGPLPAELGSARSLLFLNLQGNDLSGAIPPSLGGLDRLSLLNASGNQFSGAIPEALGQMSRLSWLELDDNELTGTIPRVLGELVRLSRMRLQRNRLSGCIPGPLRRFADDVNPQRGEDGTGERDLPVCAVPGESDPVIEWARDGRLTLSYGASSEGEPVSGYQYRVSADGGATWTTEWTPIPASGPGETNGQGYTLEGLADGTRYTVQVRAVNVDGPGPAATVTVALGTWMPGRVWLFEAANDARQGFVRVINHSDHGGEVRIEAMDDAGERAGPVTLAVGADAVVHFNADDIERGDVGKGIEDGIGPPGTGDWRLRLSSGLDLEILSYSRASDGFVTSLHDVVPVEGGTHRVAFFNPGSNAGQVSRLRLVNPGEADAVATVSGIDDDGTAAAADVRIRVPAGTSVDVTAAELESGIGPGIEDGALGDGRGKWRIRVTADRTIHAMSLLESDGRLTNLSTAPGAAGASAGSIALPLFPSASHPQLEGFARVINRSATAGEVVIRAFDDTDREYETVTLALDAGAAAHFNSHDLETGNAAKGLTGSTGAGAGDWRLELTSELDIDAFGYIRTDDGFVTAMHDLVPRAGDAHRVTFLNPGSNDRQVSRLRLVNPGDTDTQATITAVDDGGADAADAVRVRVPAGASLELTSMQLESGDGDGIVDGALGDGRGKWRLRVESDQPIHAMSILASPTGHLTNLSTAPGRGASP